MLKQFYNEEYTNIFLKKIWILERVLSIILMINQ